MERLSKIPKHDCPLCGKRTPEMHVISHARWHSKEITFPNRKLTQLVNWIKRFYPIPTTKQLEIMSKVSYGDNL